MAQNVTVAGASYQDVPSVELPTTGGGTSAFYDVSDTTAAASDVASGKYFFSASGVLTLGTATGGGAVSVVDTQAADGSTIREITAVDISSDTVSPGVLLSGYTAHDHEGTAITGTLTSSATLIDTQQLGHLEVDSTVATGLDKTVTVSNLEDYDILFYCAIADNPANGYHKSTVSLVYLYGDDASDKDSALIYTTVNSLLDANGTVATRASSTSYGIYQRATNYTYSDGTLTTQLYGRYKAEQTGVIDDDYTLEVYGIKLSDIGM